MRYAIIHIADIHYRKGEPEGASSIINAFINDVEKQKKCLTEYRFFLAITGDIVYEGDDNESYEKLYKEFNNKLNNIGLEKEYRMLVPGNHDVQQNIINSNFEEYQDNYRAVSSSERKFNDFICDKDNYEQKFENYELFESDFSVYGIGFSSYGRGWKFNRDLGIYCLNTAIGSLGGLNKIKDDGKLSICTRKLIEWCKENENLSKILLMHHPISYLNKWSHEELKIIIENNFFLCLSGHKHEQDLFYNKITNRSLIFSSPQLYTKKYDYLGYSIILIDDCHVTKVIYRQYVQGQFLVGSRFSGNDKGIVVIQNDYLKNKDILEQKLRNALAFFKGQPIEYVEPKLSKKREFNNDDNMLHQLIQQPYSSLIVAHPQFGLTCLAQYLRLEAYKNGQFWIYLDAKNIKARNIDSEINDQLKFFSQSEDDIKCIIIDSWDSAYIDHRNILKNIDNKYSNIPILIMSNYSSFVYTPEIDFSKLKTQFECLHLQAFQRGKVREFVSKYNKQIAITEEDELVKRVTSDLQALNVHRTPINILTLLKVFEKNMDDHIHNRTKMIKAVLFILFTDSDSFTYSSNKPNVDDCEYILGKFCKYLLMNNIRKFSELTIKTELKSYCDEQLLDVDIDIMLNILESNNILIRYNNELEFKHRYWIYYFAATCMLHDHEFENYIFSKKKYINFPEIIEFYTGTDQKRENAVLTLLSDLNQLIDTVNNKIGIKDNINPLDSVVWNPSKESINAIKQEISDIVQKSSLPIEIKDQHADKFYNSEAPYDQSINQFLYIYSVISLMQSIRASSKALRNSSYINSQLKIDILKAIFNGWQEMSKVLFLLSPTLARKGKATYDGLCVILSDGFDGEGIEKIKKIFLANPQNVVELFKDDLSSKKNGPLIYKIFNSDVDMIQKHFISLYIIQEKPTGWRKELFNHVNLLHRNSFYLGDISSSLSNEMENKFPTKSDMANIKNLMSVVVAKHENAPKSKLKEIPPNMTLNNKNKLPVDLILATGRHRNK